MILAGSIVGLTLGLIMGGRLDGLINVRLRFVALIFLALAVRYGTQFAISNGVALAEGLRVPLYAGAFGVLVGALWLNRRHAGLSLVALGAAMNGIAIVVNGGYMPVYLPALELAGLPVSALDPTFHTALPVGLGLDFLLGAGPLADIVPLPIPFLTNVNSLGDVAISIGLGWFVLARLLRGDPAALPQGIALWSGRAQERSSVTMDQPMLLGSPATPSPGSQANATAAAAEPGTGIRAHAYVRLARDPRFTAFWLGQTISLFGDRLHQVALGVLVLAATNSALATGLVFMAATLPNLLLGPVAGTFVDRWDHKRVMVISDLLRAGLVLLVPAAASTNIVLIYPLVFAITAVSLFFRPAKTAVVPRLVRQEDLLAANSATWTGETMADILGYPLAGLFVALLGSQPALAFWVDAASYVISAVLIGSIFIPAIARETQQRMSGALRTFLGELRDGWHMLRGQPVLFQNTMVSTFAQLSVGATIALTVVYARDALDGRFLTYPHSFAAIETAIGLGNLCGGLAVGIIGARLGKGRMVVAGFFVMGISTIVMGLTGNILVAMAAAAVSGIANLVYVIPSQTLFAIHTPIGYMGRVVAFRSTLVFGAMTGAMAASGVLAEFIPVGLVIAGAGLVTVLAAIVGWLLPAVRDA